MNGELRRSSEQNAGKHRLRQAVLSDDNGAMQIRHLHAAMIRVSVWDSFMYVTHRPKSSSYYAVLEWRKKLKIRDNAREYILACSNICDDDGMGFCFCFNILRFLGFMDGNCEDFVRRLIPLWEKADGSEAFAIEMRTFVSGVFKDGDIDLVEQRFSDDLREKNSRDMIDLDYDYDWADVDEEVRLRNGDWDED